MAAIGEFVHYAKRMKYEESCDLASFLKGCIEIEALAHAATNEAREAGPQNHLPNCRYRVGSYPLTYGYSYTFSVCR